MSRRIMIALALTVIFLTCTWFGEDLETEFVPELDRKVVLAIRRGFPLPFYYNPKFLPTVPALIPLGLILDLTFWFAITYSATTLAGKIMGRRR